MELAVTPQLINCSRNISKGPARHWTVTVPELDVKANGEDRLNVVGPQGMALDNAFTQKYGCQCRLPSLQRRTPQERLWDVCNQLSHRAFEKNAQRFSIIEVAIEAITSKYDSRYLQSKINAFHEPDAKAHNTSATKEAPAARRPLHLLLPLA